MSFRICPTSGCQVSADHYHNDGHAYAVRYETDASLRSRIAALEEERDRLGVWNEKLSIELGCMREEAERSRCYRKALEEINNYGKPLVWVAVVEDIKSIARRALAPQDEKL